MKEFSDDTYYAKKILKIGLFILVALVIFSIVIFISSCSAPHKLSRSPSEQFLISIKPNNKVKISYKFESLLSEPHTLVYNNFKHYFPLNSAYKANLDTYMKTKFMKIVEDKGKYDIHYKIISFNITFFPFTQTSEYRESAQLKTYVKVFKNNKLLDEKSIDIETENIIKSMNCSLIVIDMYLKSLGL